MKHTPGPWTAVDAPGAGIEIYGDVRATMGERFTELVEIFGTSACNPPRFQIAYERWVQFPKREWREMQRANAYLMASAPELVDALTECCAVLAMLTAPDRIKETCVQVAWAQAVAAEAKARAVLAKAAGN